MTWLCVIYDGDGKILKMYEKLNADKYIDTLQPSLSNTLNTFCGDEFVFQQDSASVHTAR